MNHLKAVGLIRVSSDEQVKGGYGLEFQEQDIRAFCARNELDLAAIFRDDGYSGASENRPGFQEMMQRAREKQFQVLVVWKLDRLFRDTRLTLQTIDELAGLGVEFRSVHEAFTHDSNGRFLLTIFAAGAEKERKDINLRMSAGRVAAAKRGTWISGGGTPPYGYKYNSGIKRLEVDEVEAALVRQLYQWLVDEQLSLYKIQNRVNELRVPTKFDRLDRKKATKSKGWWNKRTIGRILSNEVYTGSFTFRKYRRCGSVQSATNLRPTEDWIPTSVPAIISKEIFDRAQEQLQRNRANSPRRTKELYLLQKLLVCGHDGRRLQAARRPPNQHRECKYYFCSAKRKGFSPVPCPSRSVSESRIAPPVWSKLKELLLNPELVLAELAKYQREKIQVTDVEKDKRQLALKRESNSERKNRLVELYLGQAIDKSAFQNEHRRLRDEADALERQWAQLKQLETDRTELIARIRSANSLYEKYKDRLEVPPAALKREILKTFVKNIVVKGENLEIEVALPPPASFEGQQVQLLSRKHATIFLTTRLVPISEIFRNAGVHKNFGSDRGNQKQPLRRAA